MTDHLPPLLRDIRSERQRLGLTQTEVAEQLGLSLDEYWRFEHNQKRLDQPTLERLLALLHMNPARAQVPGEYIPVGGSGLVDTPVYVLIREARMRKGWSQDRLAEELRRVGLPASRGGIKRIEDGTAKPDVDMLRLIADVLDIDRTKLGLAGDGITFSESELLPVIWDLYYNGRSSTIRPLLPTLSSHLGRSRPSPMVVLGYQVLGVMLRDQDDPDGAERALGRAIELAREVEGVQTDLVAAALFRRSNVPLDRAARLDPAVRGRHYQSALRDSAAAVDLAARCRPMLRAVLYQHHAKVLAHNGEGERTIQVLLDQAATLAGTYTGRDESGVTLNPSGVLHAAIESNFLLAQTRGYRAGLERALADSITALATLDRDTQRWRVNIGVSQAEAQAALGFNDMVLETADELIPLVLNNGSGKILRRLRTVLTRIPESAERAAALSRLE